MIALGISGTASADQAAELFKQGTEAYKQGKYEDAARLLEKAYDLDKSPNTLFALAQAERLMGQCKQAVVHYKKVLEQISDLNVAKLVQQNLSLCEKQEPSEPRSEGTKAEPAAPQVITKTVTRDVGHADKVATTLAVIGGISLGASAGLYMAASSNKDAAPNAKTLDYSHTLSDRAASEQTMCFVAAGVGVAALGYAIYRWSTGGSESASASAVSIVPTRTGGAAVWTGHF